MYPLDRTNIVNVLGNLCCSVAAVTDMDGPPSVLDSLVPWLVDTAARDRDPRVAAEALDKLFDVFSEDDTDSVFARLEILNKFKALVAPFRKISSSFSGEEKPVIQMVNANLIRFVKYKEKRPLMRKNLK